MDIRPIKTDADYDWALAEITQYFDNQTLIALLASTQAATSLLPSGEKVARSAG